MTADVVHMARQVARRPIWVKLSPNVTDIRLIAKAAQGAGADALTVANTYPAMSVDFRTHRSRLGRISGGLSGPAIKPITLRLRHLFARSVTLPIIGPGGVEFGGEVLEYMGG